MRRYIAIAPRGVTIEYAVDRMLTVLQQVVRRLATDPGTVCAEAGVDPVHADLLLSLFGTDVVYGNTLRDLDAVERSSETQIAVEGPPPNAVSLTGRTGYEDVRSILNRLARIIHEKCAIKGKPLISLTTMRMGCLMKFFAMKFLAQVFGGLGRFRAVR